MKLILSTFSFYLFLLLFTTLQSQNSKEVDSISHKSFDELFDLFYESKPDTLKATFYANAYFKKALKEKDTMEMISSKKLLANIKNDEKIYLNYCDSLIHIVKLKPNKKFPTFIHLNKTQYFLTNRENSKAQKELIAAKNSLFLNKSDSLESVLNFYTGCIHERIENYDKAIRFYKKSYRYNLERKNDLLINLNINIAATFIKDNKIDSATIYNENSIRLLKNLSPELLNYAFYTKGLINFKQGKHEGAIISFEKSLSTIKDDENFDLLTSTYSYIGSSSDFINDKKKALKYHLKADSLSVKKKIKRSNLENSYLYLLKNAKDQNNLENQLLYTERLLEIKEFNLTEKNKLTTTFTNEFDIPNLVKEKEILQQKIQQEKNYKILFISVIVCSLLLLIYQIRKKKFYRKQFEKIINTKEQIVDATKKTVKKSSQQLSEEIVTSILKQLTLFEKNKDFLSPDINLNTLASTFNTNSNYLSKIVNQYKDASFSNYIHQLRIDHVIDRLKTDTTLRKYTIKAIANEVGYKNVESFSKAFYKYTQLKPSYFIKELEKTS